MSWEILRRPCLRCCRFLKRESECYFKLMLYNHVKLTVTFIYIPFSHSQLTSCFIAYILHSLQGQKISCMYEEQKTVYANVLNSTTCVKDWWCKTADVMMVWRVCFRPKFVLQNSLLSDCPPCRWACLRFTPQCQSACRSKLKASSCAALTRTQTREPQLQSSWRTAFWRAVPGRGQSFSPTLWKNQPVSL